MASKQSEKSKATFMDWMALAVLLAVLAGVGFGAGYRLLTYPSTETKSVTLETRVTCLEEWHDWGFERVDYVGWNLDTGDGIPVWIFSCLRCGKKEQHSESTMTDKFWRLVEWQSGLKRPQDKPVAIDVVVAKACAPCSHQWSCVGFKDGPIDRWDVWTFKCSKCNLTYTRDREALHEAEMDLIEQWSGERQDTSTTTIFSGGLTYGRISGEPIITITGPDSE